MATCSFQVVTSWLTKADRLCHRSYYGATGQVLDWVSVSHVTAFEKSLLPTTQQFIRSWSSSTVPELGQAQSFHLRRQDRTSSSFRPEPCLLLRGFRFGHRERNSAPVKGSVPHVHALLLYVCACKYVPHISIYFVLRSSEALECNVGAGCI
jgi:hypothetical protein